MSMFDLLVCEIRIIIDSDVFPSFFSDKILVQHNISRIPPMHVEVTMDELLCMMVSPLRINQLKKKKSHYYKKAYDYQN